jgi:hypothetical protein
VVAYAKCSKTFAGKPAIYHLLAPLRLTIHDWLETRQGSLSDVGQYRVEAVVVVEKTKYNVGSKISPQLRQGPTPTGYE